MAHDHSSRTTSSPQTFWAFLAFVFGIAVLAAVLMRWVVNPSEPLHNPEAQPREVTPATDAVGEEKATIDLFKQCKDSVVNVDTTLVQRDRFSLNVYERQQGTGSGFIWDDQGHIVTNFHVIQEALRQRGINLRVTLADRTPYNARIVDYAPDHDLAVLKIDAPAAKLKKIRVGSSSDLQVGQNVYAIGNPFGLTLTLTKGIISALDREIQSVTNRPISGVIQTDAAINPGNSGGPLLDRDGRLIGVNTAIASPSGANAGIGFAIPVDLVNPIVTELIRGSRSPTARPALNVVLVGDQLARELGVARGVLIRDVMPNGAAAQAGLRGTRYDAAGNLILGDVIVAIDDQKIETLSDLMRTLGKYSIGQKVRVVIVRDGATLPVEVTLQGI